MPITVHADFDSLDIKVHLESLKINVLFIRFWPGTRPYIRNHCHGTYELHFIPQGKGILHTLERDYAIVPGTFFLTGPGIYHSQSSDPTDPINEYCINFDIETVQDESTSNLHYDNEMKEIAVVLQKTHFWFGKDDYNSTELFEKIYSELTERIMGYYPVVKACIAQIVINAARSYLNGRKSSYNIPARTAGDKRKLVLDGYLYYKYNTEFSMEDVARDLGVTVRQLDRIVKEYYSMTFKEKLISVRLEVAKDLLQSTKLSISEVAEKVGFTSDWYFSKTFKKKLGMSPSGFRKQFNKK